MQRLTEPLLISAGTLTTFISTFSVLSNAQTIVALGVGVITIVYTAMKVVKLYHELKEQYKNTES
jgi:hypothetical protein